MGKGRYDFILLDLDGTVTDSQEGLMGSFRNALDAVGAEYDDVLIKSFLGPPANVSLKKTYGFDDATLDIAMAEFRRSLQELGVVNNTVYPGVREFLEWGKAAGKKLIIATSKTTSIAKGALKYCGLYDYFDMIAGRSEVEGDGFKYQIVEYVLKNFPGITLERSVMIGDRAHDIEGAEKNDMDAIGVLYGYGTKEELEKASALVLCETLDDVRRYIEGADTDR